METQLLAANADGAVARAATLLAAGEIVALPTETVYGLAADAARPEAVAAIFQAKERPFFDPLIVHLPSHEWLERLTRPDASRRDLVERLIAAFWPGPLTLLLPRRPEAVPDLVTAGSDLVAVRMSAHPVFAAVLRQLARPVAAPSANRFGRISPTTGVHVFRELGGRIPLILDAGPATHGLESTVVSLAESGEEMQILRPGPVTAEMLAEHGSVIAREAKASQSAAAPGQLPGHYAPRTPLQLLPVGDLPLRSIRPRAFTLRFARVGKSVPSVGENEPRVGLLSYQREHSKYSERFARIETLSESGDLREAAANLFAALRALDEAGLDLIVAETVPEIGLGVAIMERLRRAETGSGLA